MCIINLRPLPAEDGLLQFFGFQKLAAVICRDALKNQMKSSSTHLFLNLFECPEHLCRRFSVQSADHRLRLSRTAIGTLCAG
ncbi:MAG: hypothetical protein WC959_00865 [Kiritimatiellales bacterium]